MNHVCRKPQRNMTINVIVAHFYDPTASKLYLFGSTKYATTSYSVDRLHYIKIWLILSTLRSIEVCNYQEMV